MKKNYLRVLSYALILSTILFTSCNQEDESQIIETDKTTLEPDFFERDGSIDLEDVEEDAPIGEAKTYGHYNYTLLKPSELTKSDVDDLACGESTTMPLLAGYYKKQVGEVQVTNDGENLYLNFSASDKNYMKKVYLYIGEKGSIPFYSNGFPNLRKFNYKAFPYYYGGTKNATYVIPLSSIDLDCFEIVAYSKVYNSISRCYYSSFAYDSNRTQQYYYSRYSGCYYFRDWVRSFEFCKTSCDDGSMDVFGRKVVETFYTCLDVEVNGKLLSGFSSKTRYRSLKEYADTGRHFELYMYVNDEQCVAESGLEIGRVEFTGAASGDGVQATYHCISSKLQ